MKAVILSIALWAGAVALSVETKIYVFHTKEGRTHYVAGTIESESDADGNHALIFEIGDHLKGSAIPHDMYLRLVENAGKVNKIYFGKRTTTLEVTYFPCLLSGIEMLEDDTLMPAFVISGGVWDEKPFDQSRGAFLSNPRFSPGVINERGIESQGMSEVDPTSLGNGHFLLPMGATGQVGASVFVIEIVEREVNGFRQAVARFFSAADVVDAEGRLKRGARNVIVYELPLPLLSSVPEWWFRNHAHSGVADYTDFFDLPELTPLPIGAVKVGMFSSLNSVRGVVKAQLKKIDCQRRLAAMSDATQPKPESK